VARQRLIVVYAAYNAYAQARVGVTCAAAWDLAGLSALHWDGGERIWAGSKFITEPDLGHDPELDAMTANPGRFRPSGTVLTAPEMMAQLVARSREREPIPVLAP
jgi:hypothetical protein